jgi:hypothetical protein
VSSYPDAATHRIANIGKTLGETFQDIQRSLAQRLRVSSIGFQDPGAGW